MKGKPGTQPTKGTSRAYPSAREVWKKTRTHPASVADTQNATNVLTTFGTRV